MTGTDTDLTIATLRQELKAVYRERAHLLAFMAVMLPAVLADTDPDTPGWPVLTFGGGPDGQSGQQMCWHIAPDDVDLFAHMPREEQGPAWDGHSTAEKYERLRALTALASGARDEAVAALVAAEEEATKSGPDTGSPGPEQPAARGRRRGTATRTRSEDQHERAAD